MGTESFPARLPWLHSKDRGFLSRRKTLDCGRTVRCRVRYYEGRDWENPIDIYLWLPIIFPCQLIPQFIIECQQIHRFIIFCLFTVFTCQGSLNWIWLGPNSKRGIQLSSPKSTNVTPHQPFHMPNILIGSNIKFWN